MATVVTQRTTGNAEIDGLLMGVKWSGTVTYSFPDSKSDYAAGYYGGEPNSSFRAISAQQRDAAHYAFALIESYTLLNLD